MPYLLPAHTQREGTLRITEIAPLEAVAFFEMGSSHASRTDTRGSKNSKFFSRAFSGPPRREARPVDQYRCSARGARARRHTSSIDDQSAAPAVSPTSADSPVRAGQKPVDLVLRAISNRWQVHCEIIGKRSIF